MIKVDHVAIAVQNLYRGYMEFEKETGFVVIEGGYFPEFGIANKLIPTGDTTFIEIEAAIDYRAAMKSPFGRYFYEAVEDGPKWIGWCLRVDDMDELQAVADRLGSTLQPNALVIDDDGGTQESVYYMANGQVHPPQFRTPDASVWWKGLPTFFVMDTENHVGNTPLPHKQQPDGFAWLEVGGTEKQWQDWIGVHPDELNIRCNGRERPGLYAVAVKTDAGDVVIRHDW